MESRKGCSSDFNGIDKSTDTFSLLSDNGQFAAVGVRVPRKYLRLRHVSTVSRPGDMKTGAAAFGTLGHDRPWSKTSDGEIGSSAAAETTISGEKCQHFVKNVTSVRQSI
jgi:hypothetical protein